MIGRELALAEQVEITLETVGNTMTVKADKPTTKHNRSISISYTITVPKQTRIECASSYGAVKVSDINANVKGNSSSGSIAAEIVAKSAPDGYTILIDGSPLWLTPLFRSSGWDPLKDFAALTLAVSSPSMLVVHPSINVSNLKDLIALAKQRPGDGRGASILPVPMPDHIQHPERGARRGDQVERRLSHGLEVQHDEIDVSTDK